MHDKDYSGIFNVKRVILNSYSVLVECEVLLFGVNAKLVGYKYIVSS